MTIRKIIDYIIKFLFLFTAVFLLWMSINAFIIHQFSYKYSEKKSDVAIVLGAGTNDGKLSPIFRERVNHGIYLWKDGIVDYLIFTGGMGENQSISDSKIAQQYAIQKGVASDKILIEEQSTVTFSNFTEAKKIMKSQGFSTALIVSDPYHMKRSMAICKAVGITGNASPTPTTMYRSWQPKLRSLLYESFYHTLDLMFGRY